MNNAQSAPCYVQQIGTAVPETSLNVEQSAQLLADSCINPRSAKLLGRIDRLTGIDNCHLAALEFQNVKDQTELFQPAAAGAAVAMAMAMAFGPGLTIEMVLLHVDPSVAAERQ